MRTGTSLVLALAAASSCAAAASKKPPPITAREFPSVSKRVAFFAERINSADPKIRVRALTEAGYFFITPDREYEAFLKRLTRDPDPVLAGRAVHKLHDMYVPIDVKDLPRRFAGYHDGHIVDLGNMEATIAGCLEACRAKGIAKTGAGYAAYVLGLLKHKPAVPVLKKLADHENIFVRFSAGRALLSIGDAGAARAILRQVVRSQLEWFERLEEAPAGQPGKTGWPHRPSPWYAAHACRALMEIDRDGRKEGLEGFIRLMGFLERSRDVNDRAKMHSVRLLLANVTGRWLPTHADARRFYAQWARTALRRTAATSPVK